MSQRITVEATYLFDEKSPCFIPRHVLFMLKTPVTIDPHGKSGYRAVHFSFGFLKQRMTMELRFPFFHGRRTLLSNAVLHGAWGWAAGTASGGKRPRALIRALRGGPLKISRRVIRHICIKLWKKRGLLTCCLETRTLLSAPIIATPYSPLNTGEFFTS